MCPQTCSRSRSPDAKRLKYSERWNGLWVSSSAVSVSYHSSAVMPSPGDSEVFERGRPGIHAQAQVRHENEVRMRAARDQRVPVAGQQRPLVLRVEPQLAHGGRRVGGVARAERVVGLEREETTVESVRARRRKAIVRLVAHTDHSRTALPWCHDG